jgi:hypothetical protein
LDLERLERGEVPTLLGELAEFPERRPGAELKQRIRVFLNLLACFPKLTSQANDGPRPVLWLVLLCLDELKVTVSMPDDNIVNSDGLWVVGQGDRIH